MHYEELVPALINLGMKGNTSVSLFLGRKRWEELNRRMKRTYEDWFLKHHVPYMVVDLPRGRKALVLGADRVRIAMCFYKLDISARERNIYLERFSEGKFPNPECEVELAMELDFLTK